MKKIMMAAAIVCAAVGVQAASVNWATGEINELKIDGSPVDFSMGQANWIVFENSTAYTAADIWAQYQAGTLAGTKVGELDTYAGLYYADPGFMAMAGGSSYTEGDQVYFASIIVYNEDKDFTKPSYYMINTGVVEASDADPTYGDLGNTIGGIGGTGDTVWQSVPEPTSGLLLLIGVAGLALRRRRA